MSRASERLRQVFERRYHIAMMVLAAAVTVTFLASYRVSLLENDRAKAVILATEQRALSQRVAFLIKAIDQKPDPAHTDYLRQELLITIERMRNAHRTLIGDTRESKNLERFIEPLQGIYFSGYVPFDGTVQRFLEDAEAIAAISPYSSDWAQSKPRREAIVTAATASMMQTHALVLKILEAKAEEDDKLAQVVDLALWLSVMCLVLIITLVIFRPMSKEIMRAFEEVEGARSQAKRAEAEAVAANEDKGNFFQAASHELKTPLNAILGMTDSLKEKEGATEFEEEISHITAAGDHLLALLNNILDTHRLSEGELSLQTTSFKLAETISRSVNLARALAGQKGLDFESNVDVPEDLGVLGDPARLEQVLNNLLDNAVKFTRAGKVTFDAFVDQNEEAKAGLNVAIGDTGIGIREDRLDAVFERFSAEGPMRSRGGGLGIGLALSRELTELMGGSIDVESQVGKGSTFLLHVPLEISAAKEAAAAITYQEEGAENALSGQGGEGGAEGENDSDRPSRREFDVLIVDDNMANRMVAEALVKPLGGCPVMAVDGRQAVKKAGEKSFDIILMDISMPVMDGIEATSIIRSGTGSSKRCPIIAVTAHATASDFEELREAGFQDLITKPVRKDSLSHCIEKWTMRKSMEEKTA